MKNVLIAFLGISTLAFAYFYFTKSDNLSGDQAESCQSPIAVYEDPTRIPLRNFVLEEMGDLSGKTVADIGAGPGFFAFEMAETARKVVATELDPMFLDYMEEKKSGLDYDNFEVLEGRDDHSELADLELDYALMVFVFHYLEDPKLFLEKLKSGMNPRGRNFYCQWSNVLRDHSRLSESGWLC